MRKLFHRCAGSTITEYAIIISIVSIAGIVLLMAIGNRTANMFNDINSNMPQ